MSLKAFWNKMLSSFGGNRSNPLERIHGFEPFQAILHQQMCRSDRNGKNLAMVVFTLPPEPDLSESLDRLLALLESRTRCFDEIGWYEDQGLGIVLPDTSEEGAGKLAKEIVTRMETDFSISMRFALYTFVPEKQAVRGDQTERKEMKRQRILTN